MITICLLITVFGIAVLCFSAVLWEKLEPAFVKVAKKIKRGLCARWLAEDGLTVRPLTETDTALQPVTVSVDEFLALINDF